MSESNYISIKGAKVNNLKNIDVNIPRNKLVVITGLSGSGKSSLAFDTLYAEGQRRYVESLSSYARQFLGRMSKPECDFIKGIPPAIAIEQKVNSRNPRSTVGTSTEIYEYLRLLYARVGKTYSPISGQLVKKHNIEDIVSCMLSFPKGTKYTVLTPMMPREGRTLRQQLEMDFKQGFTRVEVNREIVRIEDFLQQTAAEDKRQNIYLLVDRMTADNGSICGKPACQPMIAKTVSAASPILPKQPCTRETEIASSASTLLTEVRSYSLSALNSKPTELNSKNRMTKCFHSIPLSELVPNAKASVK